ncbi:hypothetical protein LINPERHAP2_LOCUS17737 [Linum perenne]
MSAIVESSEHVEQHAGEEGEDDELSWSSDSEIADALDWLDAKDNGEAGEGSFALNSRRPNAHGFKASNRRVFQLWVHRNGTLPIQILFLDHNFDPAVCGFWISVRCPLC